MSADDTLMLSRGQTVHWRREEALGSVQKVLVTDLPHPGSVYAPHEKRPLSLMELLNLNILVLKVRVPQ